MLIVKRFCFALGLLAMMAVTPGLIAEDAQGRQRVLVQPHLEGAVATSSARLDLTWTGGRPVDEAERERSFTVELGAPASPLPLDLPDETVWQVELVGDEIYSPTTLVNLLGDDDPARITLPVYPTVPLTATLRLSDEGTPSEATLRFQPTSSSGVPEAGEVDCFLDEIRATCPIPRVPDAHLDLKLRVPGTASHFVWEREIPEAGLDLGSVELVVGGSLVGRVEAEDGALPTDPPVSVSLVPAGTVPGQEDTERRQLLNETVPVDSRGFFHFRGVPSGSYRVQAEADGFALAVTSPIPLVGAVEGELAEPLVLRRPLELAVRVEPGVDSQGESWMLSLVNVVGGQGELVDRGETDETGSWITEPLPGGTYQLMVVDSRGTRMAVDEVTLSEESPSHVVRLENVPVEGEVRLGGEPLPAARVIFGGRGGRVSVEMTADDFGRFAGTVPRTGEWDVEVLAFSPDVSRRLSAIEVVPDAEGAAWIAINLPSTELSGDVVDAERRPVAGVHVLLLSGDERPLQTRTNKDGEFAFHGLEPGRYRVEARHFAPEQTAVVEGEWLSVEDDEIVTTRLVLAAQQTLVGRVWLGGQPAAGARIFASSDQVALILPDLRTGVDGRFSLEVPRQLDRVTLTVLLPGAELPRQTVSLGPSAEEATIRLSPTNGSTLVLTELPSDGRATVVYEGRQRFSSRLLRQWAVLNGSGEIGRRLPVPGMPPGRYEYCPTTDSCVEGYLPPSGELVLSGQGEDPPTVGAHLKSLSCGVVEASHPSQPALLTVRR